MVNKVILIGSLGQDPELRSAGSTSVCSLRLATNEKFKDKDGNMQERTEWHSISVWGRQGENVAKFCKKGKQLYIEGRLQTRSWEKDGVKRYTTEIVAGEVRFLGGGSGGGERDEGSGQRGGYGRGSDESRGNYGARSQGGGNPRSEEAPSYAPDEDIPF